MPESLHIVNCFEEVSLFKVHQTFCVCLALARFALVSVLFSGSPVYVIYLHCMFQNVSVVFLEYLRRYSASIEKWWLKKDESIGGCIDQFRDR